MTARLAEKKQKGIRNRRSGFARRQFMYSSYIPDRRSGRERRALNERRMTDRGIPMQEHENT